MSEPHDEERARAERQILAALLGGAVQAGTAGGLRWHRERERLAIRPIAASAAQLTHHRARAFLALGPGFAAFWRLLRQYADFGDAGFFEAADGMPRRVLRYLRVVRDIEATIRRFHEPP